MNQVRLLDGEGQQLGVCSLDEALDQAKKQNLDLVLINGSANPAICKIMDYGKYKFDTIKKEKEIKKNQKVVNIKEIQLSMTIDTHDMETKARHGNKFLAGGDKLKVILRMRGRQQAFAKNCLAVVEKFYEMVSENGVVDKKPEIVGRNIVMIVNPKK